MKFAHMNAALYYSFTEKAPKKIMRVIYDITYRCNLRCDFCYYWNQDREKSNIDMMKHRPELTTEEIKNRLIPQLKKAKVSHVTITGGEPLIKKDIIEILEEFSKHFHLTLLSNLSIENNEKLDAILKYVDSVKASIDLEKVFVPTRGVEGSFDKTVNSIKYLVSKGIKSISLNAVLTPDNCTEISKVIDMANDMGVKRVTFQFLDWQTPETIKGTPFLEKPEIFGTLVNKVTIDAEKTLEQINIAQEKAEKYGMEFVTFPVRLPLTKEIIEQWYTNPDYQYTTKCLVPWFQLRINPYGGVMPCMEYDVGNIKDLDLQDIWNGSKYNGFRRVIRKGLLPRCNKCCKIEKSYSNLIKIKS
ncbi:MAG: radical SAM protein [Candidatus Woesearchaeota archaeon]|nr:radical SAM protein [Candidatus Woesearchaeota archaeon]MDP7323904.1 radical SAM protein [Candidatus Woesearchaeota archaeon]